MILSFKYNKYMVVSSYYLKPLLKWWRKSEEDFSGPVVSSKRSIIWSNGPKYANPRRREDWGIKTLGKWTLVSGVNGGASLKLMKVFGRIESGLSIYVTKSPVCLIPNIMNDSPLWKDMMMIRHIYLKGREYHITNDQSISVRMDTWLGDKHLCV
jgi:hypothetical protein